MEHNKGIHFYININNFEDIVDNEEIKQKTLSHSIHLLNSYFSGIERYAKTNCESIQIEKITSGRIHLFSIGKIEETIKDVLKTSFFAYLFSKRIMAVGKYNSLLNMTISVGASFGEFFTHEMPLDKDISEFTSIGYTCNFAAKLQSVAKDDELAIDSDISKICVSFGLHCAERTSVSFGNKYGQNTFYIIKLSALSEASFIREDFINSFIDKQIDDLNSKLLGDMSFTDTNKNLNFESLNLNDGRRFFGIPFYSDVRNFTAKFNSSDNNIIEMANKVVSLMNKSFNVVKDNGGTHIQFQGDREFAVFVISNTDISTLVKPIITGLKMIDEVSNSIGLKVGVGMSYGRLHATRIGIRNEKDNLLIGRAVNLANVLEDSYAKDNQLAISGELYKKLKNGGESTICSIFTKVDDEIYVTNYGYQKYIALVQKKRLEKANNLKSYNGAWRKDD